MTHSCSFLDALFGLWRSIHSMEVVAMHRETISGTRRPYDHSVHFRTIALGYQRNRPRKCGPTHRRRIGSLGVGWLVRESAYVQRLVIVLNSYGAWIVAAAFSVSGAIHLLDPKEFTPIVPHLLPFSTGLVYASGVAELTCAYGLWRRQRWAGIAATALLLLIWPANLQAAVTAQNSDELSNQVISWIRFPLQIPLIWLALRSGRSTTAEHHPSHQSP
jgi:uncharacterized membrane protein